MRHDFDDEPTIIIEKHGAGAGSFLVGIALGAAAALLFAPRTGIETRQIIGRRARDARDRALDVADDVSHQVTDQFGRARDAVTERVDRAREAVDLKRRQVQRAIDAGRTAAAEAREDLERRIAETKAAYQAGARVAREEMERGRVAGAAGAVAGGAGAAGAAVAIDGGVSELDDEI
ncbi:YtxH domain-containing protein [Roseisolibacter sp. H3M3-2]|uniref:YtxH domain-containing protein n=1 Tax=Roseisolibacter sp. H3M3-2 TaxID=3031323 RepID=UPI0023DC111E|nr:YtxH domain-containing protein [Roseisolibacter sp. H3M3-2]MDF1503321.1 YtxH domain-containing protein [Roseisolibacter sp. H3M3-2]